MTMGFRIARFLRWRCVWMRVRMRRVYWFLWTQIHLALKGTLPCWLCGERDYERNAEELVTLDTSSRYHFGSLCGRRVLWVPRDEHAAMERWLREPGAFMDLVCAVDKHWDPLMAPDTVYRWGKMDDIYQLLYETEARRFVLLLPGHDLRLRNWLLTIREMEQDPREQDLIRLSCPANSNKAFALETVLQEVPFLEVSKEARAVLDDLTLLPGLYED